MSAERSGISNSGPVRDAATSFLRIGPRHGTLVRMSELFTHIPHPHIAKRQAAGPPTVAAAAGAVHGESAIGRLNSKVGLKITMIVGTMWAAYLFTLLALISAPSAFKTGNSLVIVAWVAQTFLQLVLLPIVIVGQNIQAKASDARSQATYDDAAAVLAESLQIQAHLAAQDKAIESILNRLTIVA